MKFTPIHLLACCAIVLGPLASAGQQPSPAQRRAMQKFHERVGWRLVNGVWVRASGSCRWDELVRVGWRGSEFIVEVAPTTQAAAMLKGGRRAAVEVAPLRELYEISLHEISPVARRPELEGIARPPNDEGGATSAVPMYLLASAMDGVDDLAKEVNPPAGPTPSNSPLRIHSLMAAPGVLRVNGRGLLRGSQVSIAFFTQADRGARLTIYDSALLGGDKQAAQTFVTESVGLLVADHALEVRQYLAPLLRSVCSDDLFAPGATDVYLAFPQIAPSREIASRLNDILPRLHDAQFAVRTAAMDELRGLGSAGVCAAMHLDREQLHPQDRAMIAQFLKENSRRDMTEPADAAGLRADALFLVDCLEYSDHEVRSAAREELGKVLNKPVQVDVNDQSACARLAASLREAAFKR